MFPVMSKFIADAVFGVEASIDDQATEDQHRRSGHSLCVETQLTHGQAICWLFQVTVSAFFKSTIETH